MAIIGALLGLLLGMAIVAAMRAVVPSLFPEQGGLHSGFYVGLLPSNPDGTFARRDSWRMAGFSLAGAAACLGIAAAGLLFAPRAAGPQWLAQLEEGAGFVLVLLMLLGVAAALQHVWRALWWRPRRLVSDWEPPAEDSSDTLTE